MAQRSSRSSKNKARKQPELRTGGGRQAKTARSREREAAVARSAPTGPAVHMRPAGLGGYLFVLLFAWVGVALVVIGALLLGRWNVVDYPDSAWLFAAIGVIAVAPALGRVSRSGADADAWGIQALLVPAGLFVAEVLVGPECPNGADCAAIGARGWLGMTGSIITLVVAAILAWALARWMYRLAANRRPAQGRVRFGIIAVAMVVMLIVPGAVLAAALVGTDVLVRDTPDLAQESVQQVEEECFGLGAAPGTTARAAPRGTNPLWTSFAVRRSSESRPGIGKAGLPGDWVGLDEVYPYEASVAFSEEGEPVLVSCNRVGPDSGNATADDIKQVEPDTNPISPKTTGANFLPVFFTQGTAGPTEAGKQKIADDAKAKAAKAKADAAKAKADAAKPEAAASDNDAEPDATSNSTAAITPAEK